LPGDLVVVPGVVVGFCDLNPRLSHVHDGSALVKATRRADPVWKLDGSALLADRKGAPRQEVMGGASALASTGMFFLWKWGHFTGSPIDRTEMRVSSHPFRSAR